QDGKADRRDDSAERPGAGGPDHQMTEVRGQRSDITKSAAFSSAFFATRCSLLLVLAALFLAPWSVLLAPCLPAQAQQQGKSVRIGYLDNGTAAGSAEVLDAFRKQMIQLNWIEGKNLTIEYRYAEGKGPDRDAELAVELVHLKPDLIVVNTTSSA